MAKTKPIKVRKPDGGTRGVHLAAAELIKHGFLAFTTTRSAAGADILVTTPTCSRAYTAQVKTNSRNAPFWLVGKHSDQFVSKTHRYIFLNLCQVKGVERFDFWVVPSERVAKFTTKKKRRNGTFYSFARKRAEGYENRWSLFGKP